MTSDTLDAAPTSYRSYEEEARELVKMTIQRSMEISIADKIEAPPVVDVAWPTGSEFTVELGEAAINQLVQSWLVGSSWKYCINYLYHKKDTHCYSVKYSEPTRKRPVPRATVSVYFYLSIHRKTSYNSLHIVWSISHHSHLHEVASIFAMRHRNIFITQDDPVLVKFVVEGQRIPLTPRDTVFHEKWLRSVIRNKISVTDAAQIKL